MLIPYLLYSLMINKTLQEVVFLWALPYKLLFVLIVIYFLILILFFNILFVKN